MARVLSIIIVIAASVLGLAQSAAAAFMSLPAVAFATRDPSAATSDRGEAVKGMLGNADGIYFAPVLFPSAGNVCAFHLVLRDFEITADATAKLLRKGFVVGGFALGDPVVMASVSSNTLNTNFRRFTDTTIVAPAIVLQAFYFVELTVPAETIEVLGVQIDFRTTACP